MSLQPAGETAISDPDGIERGDVHRHQMKGAGAVAQPAVQPGVDPRGQGGAGGVEQGEAGAPEGEAEAGPAKEVLEGRALGAEVEELRLEDEKRYIDMTPAIFVFAALAMAIRYVSLGLDDQDLYILAGIAFALMYGLRPFFSKMQRPRD